MDRRVMRQCTLCDNAGARRARLGLRESYVRPLPSLLVTVQERGSRQPTTVASSGLPVVPLRQAPSTKRQGKGS